MAGLDIAKALAAMTRGAESGVNAAGRLVLNASDEIVPIGETRDLIDSGRVTPDTNAKDPTVVVSYDTEYAIVEHEDMTAHHDQGRSAKFLERALNSSGQAALEAIAEAVRGELR